MKATLGELQEWGRELIIVADALEAAHLRGDGAQVRQHLQHLREKAEELTTAMAPPRENTDAEEG